MTAVRKVVILGATGSIGSQALEVVRALRARGHLLEVVGLAAGRQVERLAAAARATGAGVVALAGPDQAAQARRLLPAQVEVVWGPEGLAQVAALPESDLVLNAVVGAAGMRATLAALQAGKPVALANKESLVVGGELVLAACQGSEQIIPVDSEHAALAQLLGGVRRQEVDRLWITASGGAFRDRAPAELARVTPQQALAHPTWSMGPRITVDSATLVNKAFEVIEAHWLFAAPWEAIGVLLHPQSVVHALVELVDGSTLAQLAPPDMRIPIQAALTYPARLAPAPARVGWAELRLDFSPLPVERYPAFQSVLTAGKEGGTYPAVANAADEELVAAFLRGEITFPAIAVGIQEVLARHRPGPAKELAGLEAADAWARAAARDFVAETKLGS
ncbi:MAG: 1-deoxy-D-xylulose-5-phosphate reductoisomerase [Candidatus Bipolaricaulaceae bacterium]